MLQACIPAEYAIRYVFQMGNASGKQAIYRRKYEAWGLSTVEGLRLGLELPLQRQRLIESTSELVQFKAHKLPQTGFKAARSWVWSSRNRKNS